MLAEMQSLPNLLFFSSAQEGAPAPPAGRIFRSRSALLPLPFPLLLPLFLFPLTSLSRTAHTPYNSKSHHGALGALAGSPSRRRLAADCDAISPPAQIHASHPHAAGHGAAHVTPRSEREHPIQDAPAEHLHHAHRHKHDPLREHSETVRCAGRVKRTDLMNALLSRLTAQLRLVRTARRVPRAAQEGRRSRGEHGEPNSRAYRRRNPSCFRRSSSRTLTDASFSTTVSSHTTRCTTTRVNSPPSPRTRSTSSRTSVSRSPPRLRPLGQIVLTGNDAALALASDSLSPARRRMPS